MSGVADPAALVAVHAATRALVGAESEQDVVDLLVELVVRLGGHVVPAATAGADALPLDLALGVEAPLLPCAPEVSVARLNLEALLPGVVQDAQETIQRLRASKRLEAEASIDVLTGLLTRRALFRRLSAFAPGDCVVLLDLDHFKRLNDTYGHDAGDQALRDVGALLRSGARAGDVVGRYGGEELVVGLHRTDLPTALARVAELRRTWLAETPPVTFSAGIAEVREAGGGPQALQAADHALYRAKDQGRDRAEVATDDDHTTGGPA